jgi:DNA-binding NtrC family response regulator/pSer/pThr/pTyr-binding forkhead associated (FHA) protein
MAMLFFCKDNKPCFRVPLQPKATKIGRSDQCDIVLPDATISREHATIYSSEGQYLIKKHGTASLKLNGNEVEKHVLQENDTIRMGPWEVSFTAKTSPSLPQEVTQVTQVPESNTIAVANSSKGLLIQNLQLRIYRPGKKTEELPWQKDSLMIGADKRNDVVLEDSYVSGRHLKLVHRDGRLKLYDLNSTNGTYLNGVRVQEAEIEPEMNIKLGNCRIAVLASEQLQTPSPVEVEKFCGMVGSSSKMQQLYGLLDRVGPTEATALILGESGSGKELVARAIHRISPRTSGPFVAINCGAISKELIESELFGHEKGAFTGAQRRHEGAFGQARDGTLFLDEIGELPPELQPKLLRVLESKTYRRVGGNEELTANVRVVAATHQDLAKRMEERQFREDLFFRLFVLPLYIVPLRERLEDIPILAETFLNEFSPPGETKSLNPEALQKLQGHSFPGNIRELKNILLRGVILSKGPQIQPEEIIFPQNTMAAKELVDPVYIEKLEKMERDLILRALKVHDWNKTKTSEALGIAKSTLFSKIRLYDLEEAKK